MQKTSFLPSRLVALVLALLPLSATAAVDPGAYHFTTLAGDSSPGYIDAVGAEARFHGPSGVAVGPGGDLFVADVTNKLIRRVTPAGVVTTYAGRFGVHDRMDIDGAPAFMNLSGLVIDPTGNLYVIDTYEIRKLTPSGSVSTFVGAGYYGNSDGTGTEASFDAFGGIAMDPAGNLYVTANCAVRKITPAGVVTTFAGKSGVIGSNDGSGTDARFSVLGGIACDLAGNVYVVDRGNHQIRKIAPDATVSTLAGRQTDNYLGGSADGLGTAAEFYLPHGIVCDPAGNLYVADVYTIRKITPGGLVTTIAGAFEQIGDTDGTGNSARFSFARELTLDAAGNLYVADNYNHNIRRITPAGVVTTLAGSSPFQSSGSRDGTGREARFSENLGGIAIAASGNAYLADIDNHTIRKITPAGVVTTLAGSPGLSGSTDGAGSSARFSDPRGVAVDATENVYVADYENAVIRKITPSGVVTTLAGSPGMAGYADGTGSSARFLHPYALSVDAAGNVLVSDFRPLPAYPWSHHVTRKITPTGEVTTLPDIQVTDAYVHSVSTQFALDPTGSRYRFYRAQLVRIGPNGEPIGVAGTEESRGTRDGRGTAASFGIPEGLASDPAGNLYATDFNVIRKITPAGDVTTLAGNSNTMGGYSTGTGQNARFNWPHWLAADAQGRVLVPNGSLIRVGVPVGPPTITTQPASQSITTGGSVQFSVVASGVPAPTYQWFFNGATLGGSTSATLNLSSVNSANAGDYTVVVTNDLGTVTSGKATLTVSAAPPPPGGGGSGASGGGGSVEAWFALATAALLFARARKTFGVCQQ